jgi:hypothetical protein
MGWTLTILTALLAAAPAAENCLDCHADPAFRVTHPKLFNYYREFAASLHGVAGLGCADCHGGDPAAEDAAEAHANLDGAPGDAGSPGTCGRCHPDQRDAFTASGHFAAAAAEDVPPDCATCHGGMEMDFIFVTRVRETCAGCHDGRYGHGGQAPARVEALLTRTSVIKGYRSYVDAYLADRQRAEELEARYHELTVRWHRFDLDAIEDDSHDLLGEYRRAKKQALKDRDAAKHD